MYRLLFAAFCCLCLWACNTATDKTQQPTKANGQAQSKLGNPLTAEAVSLLHEYYNLKDALIECLPNDADMATQKATSIIASLKTHISNNISDTASISQMTSLDTLQMGLSQILAYKDETCEIKRVHFEKVSNGIIQFVKTIELKDTHTIYVQYCPMALNDKGANWLSSSAEIRNPYFGKKMLECGEVVETIQ